jgi:phospholipid/cholesterol/gamma-HCH transport system permease protein
VTATDKPKAPGLLDGRFSPTRPLAASGNLFAFALDVMKALPKRPFQIREFLQQAWFVASVTIIPTALVAIPFGAVIALQLGSLTRQLGAQSFTGSASVLAVLREAAPIVTALLIAGAGGSAICADLGARKIRDEIDAMEVLGISPIQRLVVPRVLAAMLIAVLLNGLVSVVGVHRRAADTEEHLGISVLTDDIGSHGYPRIGDVKRLGDRAARQTQCSGGQ